MATGMLIMWGSFLQCSSPHSSTEAEFIPANKGARNLTWISSLANELLISIQKQEATLIINNKPSTKYHEGNIISYEANDLHLLVDNKGALNISNSYRSSKRTTHVEDLQHYLQYQVNNEVVRKILVPVTKQIADFLTKRGGKILFKEAMQNIGYPA